MFSFQDQTGKVFVFDGSKVHRVTPTKKVQFIAELAKRGVSIPAEITVPAIAKGSRTIASEPAKVKGQKPTRAASTKWPEGTIKGKKIFRAGRWVDNF